MNMTVPSFFLFTVYACVNVWLPLFLRNMGYSVTDIGLLLSIFEIFGVTLPFFTGNIPVKNGRYGLFLCISGAILALVPFVLFSVHIFAVTALCLGIYAASVRGAVPVSDSYISLQLGGNREVYGRIRAVGSLGFVVANLIMQRFIHIETIDSAQTIAWMSVPALLFMLSLLVSPGVMKPAHGAYGNANANENRKPKIQKEKEGKRTAFLLSAFSPYYWLVLTVIFFTLLGQVPVNNFFSLYVREYLHSDSVALLWVISASSEIPFMFFSNRFIRRYGSVPLILVCAAVASLRNILYILFPTVAGAAAAQTLNSFTFGLFHPAAVMFAAEHANKKEHGVLAQVLYSVGVAGLAKVLGNALGGITVDKFGYQVLFASYAVFPLVGLLLFRLLYKKCRSAR